MKKRFLNFLLYKLLWIHNYIYKKISSLSVRIEGVHPKHRIMKYHDFFVDNIKETDHVLDLGCGYGALAFDVSKKAEYVTAIDIKKENILKAEKLFSSDNIEYIIADITTQEFGNIRFDVVIMSNVLEHIIDRKVFLSAVLKHSDKLLVRVPMVDRDWLTLYKRELGVEWTLDPEHHIEYTLTEFIAEVKSAGWEVESYHVRFGELYAVLRGTS